VQVFELIAIRCVTQLSLCLTRLTSSTHTVKRPKIATSCTQSQPNIWAGQILKRLLGQAFEEDLMHLRCSLDGFYCLLVSDNAHALCRAVPCCVMLCCVLCYARASRRLCTLERTTASPAAGLSWSAHAKQVRVTTHAAQQATSGMMLYCRQGRGMRDHPLCCG
jgi:hypothetical protein